MPQNKAIRVWIGLAVIVALALFSVVFVWLANKSLFSKNPRFTLRKIEVRSSGWWNGKDRNVAELLHLKPGETNLFSTKLDIYIRRLQAEVPSVEKVSITRILPDKLVFEITERIPRAFLYSPKSVWVVDANGIVMNRDTCINLDANLPVIGGFQSSESIHAGMPLANDIQPALDLITTSLTGYRSVNIAAINLAKRGQCVFVVYYRGNFNDPFRVFMPTKNIKQMFRVLVSTLEDIRAKDDPRREIDLRYNDRAVLR